MVRTTRRTFLIVSCGTVASSLLAACGQQVTPPGPQVSPPGQQPASAGPPAPAKPAESKPAESKPAEPKPAAPAQATSGKPTISVWTWTSVENMPSWEASADGFRQKYPDVTLNLQHVPLNQYW